MPELTKVQSGFIGDTPSTDYPSLPPTLDLNFARTKVLDPRINFTRESVGTFVDSRGYIQTAPANAPRFDHDPTTGECLGLLIEESRTNLLPFSEYLNNWSANGVSITVNSGISPSGNNDAVLITENAANAGHYFSYTIGSIPASTTYTFSAFVKRNGRDVVLQINNGNSPLSVALFTWNLSTGTYVGSIDNPNYPGITNKSGTVTAYPNGWYRITATFTSGTSITGNNTFYIEATDYVGGPPIGGGTPSYQGNGSSGFYIWGVQVEQGSNATSYIPTYGYASIRRPDYANIMGTNFTNFYNQNEGTFYSEFMSKYSTVISSAGFVSNNKSLSEYIDVARISSSTTLFGYVTNTSNQSAIGVNVANTYGPFFKTAHGFKNNDFMFYANGVGGTPDTSGTLPTTINMLEIGGGLNTTQYNLNGCIKRLSYYPKRLTNSQLQNLTT